MIRSIHTRYVMSNILMLCLLLCLAAPAAGLHAQLVTSMDDSIRTCYGLSFAATLRIKGLKQAPPIAACQFEITFNDSLFEVTSVDFTGTVMESWDAAYWNVSGPVLSVAGFSIDSSAVPADTGRLCTVGMISKKDTVCTDTVAVSSQAFYSAHGLVPSTFSSGTVVLCMHNTPPVVKDIPKLVLFEDVPDTLDLNTIIYDETDAMEDLHISVSSQSVKFHTAIDTSDWTLLLLPEPDWAGQGVLYVSAEDSFGMKDSTAADFSVIEIPDPPGPFFLTQPPDSSIITDNDPLLFSWRTSKNADIGDSINYRFCIDSDSLFRTPEALVSIYDTTFILTKLPENGTYFWKVVAFDNDGLVTLCDRIFGLNVSLNTGIAVKQKQPLRFRLYGAYPNPFNTQTHIVYSLEKQSHVLLRVFNSGGRLVKVLVDEDMDKGTHRSVWDGSESGGISAATGVYLVLLQTPGRKESGKILLLR